jgi:hypothetical protein
VLLLLPWLQQSLRELPQLLLLMQHPELPPLMCLRLLLVLLVVL